MPQAQPMMPPEGMPPEQMPPEGMMPQWKRQIL
jgi:hypothetical protein